MADAPDVKVVLCGGFSIIHGEVGLHDVTFALFYDPEEPEHLFTLLAFCLVRNAPPDAGEVYAQLSRVDGDGVEVIRHAVAPLFPHPLIPRHSMAFVTLENFALPGLGAYTLEVGGAGELWHQEPLPVLNLEEMQ